MRKTKATPSVAGRVLEGFIDSRSGPFDPESLSRSYGIDKAEIIRVLKMKGKYHG